MTLALAGPLAPLFADPRVTEILVNGPEQVFVVRVTGRVANFGVVITARGPGSRVEPRVVAAGDENGFFRRWRSTGRC